MTKPIEIFFLAALLCCANAFVDNIQDLKDPQRNSRLFTQKDATFGMGCFWRPSEEMLNVEGVIDTAAGYTGNPSAQAVPNYDAVCFSRDWVEGVRVVYDDEKVTYSELLDAFFLAQEPKIGSRQYASIIFPHDEEQKEAAETWLRDGAEKVREDGVPVKITTVEPLSTFYQAEGYHQRYWQKFRPRVAAVVGLIVLQIINWGNSVSPDVASAIHTFADYSLKIIGVGALLERVLDTKVEEL